MNIEQAEGLATSMLAYLVANGQVLEAFMAQSGTSPEEIRVNMADLDFLGGVVDFFLADEKTLLDFCQSETMDPTLPARARQALPGATVY